MDTVLLESRVNLLHEVDSSNWASELKYQEALELSDSFIAFLCIFAHATVVVEGNLNCFNCFDDVIDFLFQLTSFLS